MISLSIRLALTNLYKNKRIYIPYLLTCTLSVAMYYMIVSLSTNPGLTDMFGGGTMQSILGLGIFVIAFFSVLFLFYSHSFLIKKRQQEFGLYHVLGMEKKHVGIIVVFESLIETILSIILGLAWGMLMDKLMFLILARIFGQNAPLGFYISLQSIESTVILFTLIFIMILIKSLWIIKKSRPIALLSSNRVGEKEPKSSILMTVIGFVCLMAGYYIALTTKNPLMALNLFFIAVILVMIGTYCLFISGSVFILKALKKNKKYYYTNTHMISISSLIYRMKRHAVGLANICILSTMVLVMICSTVSLWIGSEDLLMKRYPREIVLEGEFELADVELLKNDLENHFTLTDEINYEYLMLTTLKNEDSFNLDSASFSYDNMGKVAMMFVLDKEDYNRQFKQNIQLNKGEIYIYDQKGEYNPSTLSVESKEYIVKGTLNDFVDNGLATALTVDAYEVVVSDQEELEELARMQASHYENGDARTDRYYAFNVQEDSVSCFDYINQHYDHLGMIECRENNRLDFISLYGGLLFLGIFLSVLFIVASTLIIYYKQLIEGYEDQDKYEILQKVGMDQKTVKKTINSQVRLFFFLPLIVAFIHIGFAFNIIDRLLKCLMLDNTLLFVGCTIACMFIYGMMYYFIYRWTSKIYYRIVKRS